LILHNRSSKKLGVLEGYDAEIMPTYTVKDKAQASRGHVPLPAVDNTIGMR
jgi:hypothetical protein